VNRLEVWRVDPDQPYGMDVEVEGVARLAAEAAFNRYHVFGFSAGGTVALACALALGGAVMSLVLLEPAFVGDDDWDPAERRWRTGFDELSRLPPGERIARLRPMLMLPGESPPPPRERSSWGRHDDLLEAMLAHDTGFRSDDLASLSTPVLVVRGGRSHPRWELVQERIIEVVPRAEAVVFPELHHFHPPYRAEPERFAATLLGFWAAASQAIH
jgi:pimeloyl-ACP methyl ester carboxylesterase